MGDGYSDGSQYSDGGNDGDSAVRPAYQTVEGIVQHPGGSVDSIRTINNTKFSNKIETDLSKTVKDDVRASTPYSQNIGY